MKKVISLFLLLSMLSVAFSGCGINAEPISEVSETTESISGSTGIGADTTDMITSVSSIPNTDTISTWTGGDFSAVINDGHTATIDAANPQNNTSSISGGDLKWFDPDQATLNDPDSPYHGKRVYTIDTAAEFVGFMCLRGDKSAYADYNYFENMVFLLNAHINFDGAGIGVCCTKEEFRGIFDGQNHVIYDFTTKGINNTYRGLLFSLLGGNGQVKNLSLLNGDVPMTTSTGHNKMALVVGGINTDSTGSVSQEHVYLENIYSNCTIRESTTTLKSGDVGSMVGEVKGSGHAVIRNCYNAGSITLRGDKIGGIVGSTTGANLTIERCTVSGNIQGANHVGGIVGAAQKQTDESKKFIIRDCVVEGNITGTGNCAGGAIAFVKHTWVEIDGFTFSGNITSGRACGGVIGADTAESKSTATNYSSDRVPQIILKKCYVEGEMTSTIADATNPASGGLVGYSSQVLTIEDSVYAGTMNAVANIPVRYKTTYYVVDKTTGVADESTPKTEYSASLTVENTYNTANAYKADEKDGKKWVSCALTNRSNAYFGGIVGCAGSSLVLKNVSMKGSIASFTNNTSADAINGEEYTIYVSAIANSTPTSPVPRYVNVSRKTRSEMLAANIQTGGHVKASDEVIIAGSVSTMAPVRVVGYQTKQNGSTNDLRYIAAIDSLPTNAWAGFKVSIQYYDNGELKTYNSVAYAETVYNTISGGGKEYKNTDFGSERLYALVISGVPASYVESNEIHDLEVSIVPFVVDVTAKEDAGATYGMTSVHGSISAQASAALPTFDFAAYGGVKSQVSKNGNYYTWKVDDTNAASAYSSFISAMSGDTTWNNKAEDNWSQTVATGVKNKFHIYTKGDTMVYVYYCPNANTFRVIVAHISEYYAYKNAEVAEAATGTWEVGMVNIGHKGNHQGLTMIIQSANGHFIIIDGGQHADNGDKDDNGNIIENSITDNVRRVYDWLDNRTDGDIIIDAWIFTHVHQDHTATAVEFEKQYGHLVQINQYMYNFPTGETAWAMGIKPDLGVKSYVGYFADIENMTSRYEQVTLLTGMKIHISNATIEVLFTHEDLKTNELLGFNNSSTVFKVTMHTDSTGNNDKTFLVTGDSMEVPSSSTGITGQAVYKTLIKQAGSMLTSDYVQMAHHGSNGLNGTGNANYDFYKIATNNYAGVLMVPANKNLQTLVNSSSKFATVANNAGNKNHFYFSYSQSYSVRSDGNIYVNDVFDVSVSTTVATPTTVPAQSN